MQVVDGGQHGAEHFAAAVQVVQVSATESVAPTLVPRHARSARTRMAGTAGVQRLRVGLVAGVTQLQVAIAGEHGAVACIAGGHDAVKHVHAIGHALHQVFGRAHAHQVARLVRRQAVRRVRHDLQHLVFGLAHAHAAHGVARKVHLHQRVQRFLAQVLKHAALHNAKQRVGVAQALKFVFAAQCPAAAHLHALARLGLGGDVALGFVRGALVELHDDVRIQNRLNLHAHLGRHEQLVAVDGAGKVHALFGDLAHLAQRPDLKTARVGQDGFVPFFELVQATKALHDVQPWAHPQMESVAQNDLSAHLVQAARHDAFDRAIRAHRHEDGRLHHPMVKGECATAGVAGGVGLEQVEFEHGRHCREAVKPPCAATARWQWPPAPGQWRSSPASAALRPATARH